MKTYLLSFLLISIRLFAEGIPGFEEVKQNFQNSEFHLLDKNENVLQVLRQNPRERKLKWTSLEEISPSLLDSIRIAEDKKFFEHSGVDWLALGDGLVRAITFSSPRGASTISMQVAGLLHEKWKPKRRNLWQKWTQIQLALELEKQWSKQQILETYLNLVTFRGELVGIASASWGLFQKHPHALTKEESLLLASMPKNPSFSLERLSQRACYLQKVQYNQEDCSKLKEFVWKHLSKNYSIQHKENYAHHLGRKVLNENKELKYLITTLDKPLQLKVMEIAKERISELKAQNVKDVGILIVENSTGHILSYIGGLFEFSKTPFVDSVVAKRQAGSTLKPFIYSLGLERKFFTLASLIDDSPIKLNVGTGIYAPNNYENAYHGFVTIKQALASSLNSPAIQVLDLVGIENAHEKLLEVGFQDLREADYYGYSMALGTVDVSLWDLTKAYLCFAREGECINLRYVPNESPNLKRVFSREVSFLISKTLSDRDSRTLAFGYHNPLSTKVPAAVKTGTSKDMRDNWCIGYTPHFTVGVWIGNHSGEPMWNVSGVSGAAFIWSDIIHYLYKNKQAEDFSIPKNVVQREVKNEVLGLVYKEWFLEGTEISKIQRADFEKIRKIKTPIPNAIYALDPDKPEKSQVLVFESSHPSSENFWRLNGKILANSKKNYLWTLERGFHVLELVDENDSIIDKVHFEVR